MGVLAGRRCPGDGVRALPQGQRRFSKPLPTAGFPLFAVGSFTLLALTVGTAYAVWTGIGAAGTATAGILLFGESAAVLRLASIGLIVSGVVGLRLAGTASA